MTLHIKGNHCHRQIEPKMDGRNKIRNYKKKNINGNAMLTEHLTHLMGVRAC